MAILSIILIHYFLILHRVINVPIPDENIAKRVNSLPRTEENSGMENIGLKRKLNMKNYHKVPSIYYIIKRGGLGN